MVKEQTIINEEKAYEEYKNLAGTLPLKSKVNNKTTILATDFIIEKIDAIKERN